MEIWEAPVGGNFPRQNMFRLADLAPRAEVAMFRLGGSARCSGLVKNRALVGCNTIRSNFAFY